jgi:hypothetical protein
MNIFLHDPNEIRVPPEDVRLTKVQITPHADGKRIKIYIELTPFMNRPNIAITITAPSGEQVAHSDILETMLSKLELTMHLRQTKSRDEYNAEISVYYQKLPQPSVSPEEVPLPEPMTVDHFETTFNFQQMDT